jgi:hypothetical protein
MIGPYRMILVNLAASFLFLGGVIIYKYIYPKKKINLFALFILISLLPLISILRTGTYQSGDLTVHTAREISFYKVLLEGNLFPRWSPEFYQGFGDPVFSFSYSLPYYVSAIFHFVGFSFLNSVKLFLASSFILSGIFMYLFVKDDLGEKAGFTAGIFYLFAPYHLVDLHFRVAVGEVAAFIFLPLCLYLTKKVLSKPNPIWLALLSVSILMLILSHQAISLAFFVIMIAYAVFLLTQNKSLFKNLFRYLIAITLGILLSAFYLIPVSLESGFIQLSIINHPPEYASLSQLLFSPWSYGFLFQGHKGELSYLVGYTQIFVVLLILYLFSKRKLNPKIKQFSIFFVILFLILFVIMLPESKLLWNFIPFSHYFQFTTRFLAITALCAAVIAGVCVKTINKKWFTILLCFVTIAYTILNWGNRATLPTVTNSTLVKTYTENFNTPKNLFETSPLWANLNKNLSKVTRTTNIDTLSGKTDIKEMFRNSTQHKYIINVRSDLARIRENTFYFPGWKLMANNLEQPIEYKTSDNMGIVTFHLKKGLYKVELIFTDTIVRKTANWISILSGIVLLIYLISQTLDIKRIKKWTRALSKH